MLVSVQYEYNQSKINRKFGSLKKLYCNCAKKVRHYKRNENENFFVGSHAIIEKTFIAFCSSLLFKRKTIMTFFYCGNEIEIFLSNRKTIEKMWPKSKHEEYFYHLLSCFLFYSLNLYVKCIVKLVNLFSNHFYATISLLYLFEKANILNEKPIEANSFISSEFHCPDTLAHCTMYIK